MLKESWWTSWLGCLELFLKGCGDQKRSLRTGRKQRPLWSLKKSASPQSSESWCRVSFCRLSLSTQMTRKQSGVGKEHSLKENHAWPTSLPSTIKQLPRWMRTEQWVFSGSTSVRFWTLSCTMFTGKLQKCRLDQWTVRRIENWTADPTVS